VTVKVSRPCEVTPASDGRYFWARNTEIKAISDAFLADVADHADLIMAGVEAETGIAFTVPVVTNDRALVFIEGRAPFALPFMRALGGSVSVGQPWADIKPKTIRRRLELLRESPRRVHDRVAAAYRWLVMSERDDDPLRSFLFGFVGLEGLAEGLTRHLLPEAKARLQSDPDHALPIDDLIWPQPEDDSQYPDRSALFSFAVLASALSPQSAVDDLAQFKTLQKDRHRIAHGKDHTLETFPVRECQSLLRRYIKLVSNHEWDQA
jgi:hypothetical protein